MSEGVSSQQCILCSKWVPATARVCPSCGTPRGGSTANGILAVGLQLAGGSYSVGRLLGRGGFGLTYLGADNRLGRQIALKEFFPPGAVRQGTTVVPPSTLAAPDYAAATRRFLHEAQVLARFQHPSIVAVYAAFQENGTAYMVMEYLRGETLGQRLERDRQPLAEDELIALARPLAEALDRVHAAGVLHRDIKPENIVVANGAAPKRPVLIDFGAARDFVHGATIRQSVVLTPGYAPLEQYGERARRGPYTDIYAFAATLYHLATGTQPAAAIDRAVGIELKPPRDLNRRLSPAFNQALLHALEMNVEQRPQSASEFFRELVTATQVPGYSGATRRLATLAAAPARAPASNAGRGPKQPPAVPRPHRTRIEQIAAEFAAGGEVQADRLRCPICRDATMVEPARASGAIRCPVCRVAGIRERIPPEERSRCPVCRAGTLRPSVPGGLMRCPACRAGTVSTYTKGRKLVVFADTRAKCDRCDADFSYNRWQDTLTLAALPNGPGHLAADLIGQVKTRGEWSRLAARPAGDSYQCDRCHAELDGTAGGAYELIAVEGRVDRVPSAHRGQQRTQLEWSKIAHQIPLVEGTHACPICAAQFDAGDGDRLTLIRAPRDPLRVIERYGGKPLPAATWRAIAAGMRRPSRGGYICPACTAELEAAGEAGYRLTAYDAARDAFGAGSRYDETTLRREDWQRVAAGRLPAEAERQRREEAQTELWAAVLTGELGDPAAETSYPERKAGGEQVLVRLAAEQWKQTRDGFDRSDGGELWITTRRIVFHGRRGNVLIPVDKVTYCGIQAQTAVPEEIVAVRRRDRARPLFFAAKGEISATIAGLPLRIEWSAGHFVELANRLRQPQ